jgi:hypothetical protein
VPQCACVRSALFLLNCIAILHAGRLKPPPQRRKVRLRGLKCSVRPKVIWGPRDTSRSCGSDFSRPPRFYYTLFVVQCLILWAACAPAASAEPVNGTAAQRAFIGRYCANCHNGKSAAAGLTLTKLDTAHPERNARQWEKVFVKLRAGMMPPASAPRPDRAALLSFVAAQEARIDAAAVAHPNPGAPALHRLNRNEYANSVRDLLDLDVDVSALLPPDDMSHGFDNMAEVLNVSPTLLQGYIRAAGKISRAAIGEPNAAPSEEIYHLPSTLSQTQHIEGAPFGTRGGIVIRHNFPADGEYRFRMTLYFTTNTFLFGMYQQGEQLEVAVNGERVALFPINPMMKVDEDLRTPPIKIKAGPQTITVAFLQKAEGPVEDFVQPFDHSLGDLFLGRTQGLTALPHLRDVAINGPYHITGVSDTPSRRRILICRPQNSGDELPAARKILAALARRAYRRPVTEADIKDLLSIYAVGRKEGDFESGIRLGVQFILANPQFVFRFERPPAHATAGQTYRLSDLELASRLSYFLWSSAPDARLLDLASRGRLKDPAVLESETRRLLADPRAEALATSFAGQWLHLRNLNDIQPDLFAFPNANRNLLLSMRRETELFFTNLIREDRDITDLLTADYTFVDGTLARHYGIPNVEGSRFRRVRLTDENRRGLLGQASILTVTSFANRTSPVNRGKWILDTLLGAPPPRPPANVPPLREVTEGTMPQSVRERLEEHRRNPACAGCHTQMDPLGFALENFDAVGAWRIRDNGFPIDARGRLVDGAQVNGPQSLRRALLAHSDAFRSAFTQKLLTYALGRGIETYDMPAVRAIDRAAAHNGYRFSSYVLGIVRSAPFQWRRVGNNPIRPDQRDAATLARINKSHLPTNNERSTKNQIPAREDGWPSQSDLGTLALRSGGACAGKRSEAGILYPRPTGGNHVYHPETSLSAHAVARHGRLAGAALARLDGGSTDSAAQNGGGRAHPPGGH